MASSPFTQRRSFRKDRSRSGSFGSDDGSHDGHPSSNAPLEPPILVYHESARSIVFRDHLRRAVEKSNDGSSSTAATTSAAGGGAFDGSQSEQEMVASEASTTKEDFLTPLPHKPVVVMTSPNREDEKQQPPQVDQLETFNTIVSEALDPLDTVVPSEAGIPPERIGGYTPRVTPLPSLDFGPNDLFEPLVAQEPVNENNHHATPPSDWSAAEAEVVGLLERQHCCVKTIKNNEWTALLHRFCHAAPPRGRRGPTEHDDIGPDNNDDEERPYPFNSFVTSTSLLPKCGRKMRCFGSPTQYIVGVVFALPDIYDKENSSSSVEETEDEAATRTETWSWPAGYSAKTEFNIDGRGKLINGRQEALVPLSVLRSYNNDYLTKDSYTIGTRFVKNAGLKQIPYNEVFLRVGGLGRLVHGIDRVTGTPGRQRSLDRGVGLPVALFVRTATFGHLISLLRTRARIMHVLGERQIKGIPLLMLDPDEGIRVVTENLQKELWKIAAHNLNPFQNQAIAHKTTFKNTDETSFQQKLDELLDLDESLQGMLTPEELARIAGGFGATDESVAAILRRAMAQDRQKQKEDHSSSNSSNGDRRSSHKLQDVVNEGLASALRSGDYHTSRQLLILYSLVASTPKEGLDEDEKSDAEDERGSEEKKAENPKQLKTQSSLGRNTEQMKKDILLVKKSSSSLSTGIPAPPPPPPLDTDRLRSATNSDGLLAVLGAAQVLRALQDGGAQKRTHEVIDAVEEWVNYGEQSVAFRISSWYDQRAAQGDLKINTETNSQFMAFVSNKAIANRKSFAQQLRDAAKSTDFTDTMRFLEALDAMLKKMHAPCLRLELLQYVLGLDNRYSVAHVARSVELAATCLDISLTGR